MMNKKETSRLGLVKYLFVLQVIAALLSFNICDINAIKVAVPEVETVAVTSSEITLEPDSGSTYVGQEKAGQAKKTPPPPLPMPEKTSPGDEPIFIDTEQMPGFPGGDTALMKWLRENTNYPAGAVARSIQGRVVVRYVILSDGSITDVQIVKSLDRDCDREAIRVVEAMPKWIPGKQGGKPVNVYFTLPIVFKLSK